MSFRVPIVGSGHFTDYRSLRSTLNKLLVNRLPSLLDHLIKQRWLYYSFPFQGESQHAAHHNGPVCSGE
jgi:hypothetical protein